MAEDKKDGQTPPKMRISLGKPANGNAPPMAPEGHLKSDTSRVDLAAAKPAQLNTNSSGEPLNIREVIGRKPDGKSSTSRISLNDSQPLKPGDAVPVAKESTSRIRIPDAGASGPVTTGSEGETTRFKISESQRLTASEMADLEKSSTVRVDLTGMVGTDQSSAYATAPIAAPGIDSVTADASKNLTARISIEPAKSETSFIPPPAAGIPDQTSPVVGAPPPKTVRLTRPAVAPKTVVLKRPEAQGDTPKTVVLKRPDEAMEEKGATARITVPEAAMEAAPSSQRKTIRIKRGEGAATPAPSGSGLRIARPAPEAESAIATELKQALGVTPQKSLEPGVFFAILAIAASLTLGVLVYVLLAQTYFPDWSWPGKII